jgi:hypothetical protein
MQRLLAASAHRVHRAVEDAPVWHPVFFMQIGHLCIWLWILQSWYGYTHILVHEYESMRTSMHVVQHIIEECWCFKYRLLCSCPNPTACSTPAAAGGMVTSPDVTSPGARYRSSSAKTAAPPKSALAKPKSGSSSAAPKHAHVVVPDASKTTPPARSTAGMPYSTWQHLELLIGERTRQHSTAP